MARKGAIEIPIAVDAGGVEKSIRNGLIDPIEDAEKALKNLGDSDAGRDIDRQMDRAQDSTEGLSRELKDARDGLKKLGFAGKDAGKDVKSGLDDAKSEAASSGKEAAASFSGGFDDVADFVQEVLANAFEGFGPLGAAAGIALAAVVGTVLSNAQATQEKLQDAREAASELARTMYENGGDLPLEDAIDSLFDKLAEEIKPNGPIQSMLDGFVDFGSRIDAVKQSARELNVPLGDMTKALSGSDLRASERVLEAVSRRLEEMKGNVATGWVWQTGPLEDVKTQLETTLEAARVADETLTAVGAGFGQTSQAYKDRVAEIGDAWTNATADAAGYFETSEDGAKSFNWESYLTDAETTLQLANDYKAKIVGLPTYIQDEANRVFSAQGALSANQYLDAYVAADDGNKGRFEAAAAANGQAAGDAGGRALADAARTSAQRGWSPPDFTVPIRVDDSAVRNHRFPRLVADVELRVNNRIAQLG